MDILIPWLIVGFIFVCKLGIIVLLGEYYNNK